MSLHRGVYHGQEGDSWQTSVLSLSLEGTPNQHGHLPEYLLSITFYFSFQKIVEIFWTETDITYTNVPI